MAEKSPELSKMPTNEEIIDELTNGIASAVIVDKASNGEKDNTVTNSNNLKNIEEHHGHECEKNSDEESNSKSKCDSDKIEEGCIKNSETQNEEILEHTESLTEEEKEQEEKDSNVEDDYIDEEALKDVEVSYTDEEKENLRKDAENLKLQGNEQFKKGEYCESAKLYTVALRTCPLAFSKDRAMMYANRAAAKSKLELKLSAIDDCTKAVELDPNYLKAYFRRAQLNEETEKLDEALADYQKVLELDPLHRDALYASKRLPEQINERNEKMKAEMMGKLKDLGNMILRPFGLSTENFQLAQDPSTGGYSVSFKQNPR